jgi:hypothetical protein
LNELLVKEFPQEGEIPVDWEQFELKIQELRESHRSRKIASPLLFRGHKDAESPNHLGTMEQERVLFRDYYSVISRIKPQIEAFTKQLCVCWKTTTLSVWIWTIVNSLRKSTWFICVIMGFHLHSLTGLARHRAFPISCP